MTRPDATLDQLRTLIGLANAQHLHDAEQWLRERVEAAEERMGVPFTQMRAAAVRCCDAGRTAYPDPCPWHATEDGNR